MPRVCLQMASPCVSDYLSAVGKSSFHLLKGNHIRASRYMAAPPPPRIKRRCLFTRIRTEQINGKAETDKQQCHAPNQFFIFETVERISFGHHHIHLPQCGHTHADDARRYKEIPTISLFIMNVNAVCLSDGIINQKTKLSEHSICRRP